MNQPAKAQEPSMEEILASIRRIIADDETAKPAVAAPPAPPPRPAALPPRNPVPPSPPVAAPRPVEPPPQPSAFDRGLMSSHTSAAVDSAFNALAQTVLVQNARTLEDLVKEMLRPLLKSWLDDNLPGMVERIVKAEIERVARGRG